MYQFPQPPDGHVTYAVFLTYTNENIITRAQQVPPARDLATLPLPADACTVYFCDAPPMDGDGAPPMQANISPSVYIARDIISAAELIARLKAKGVTGDKAPLRDDDGMPCGGTLKELRYMNDSGQAPWYAIGRKGEPLPIFSGHGITVIDADKNILMAPSDTQPRPPVPPAPRLQVRPPHDARFKI